MSQYHITNDITEDTFDSTDSLDDAIRIAKEAAENGEAGDVVCIEYNGKVIKQFVRNDSGKVQEAA